MNDCKFCQLLAGGELPAKLPNLVLETETAVVAVNRRPASAGHITIILKAHHQHTSDLRDLHLAGVGDLISCVSLALEKQYEPSRVVLLGDGKPSAHLHLHLIPEAENARLELGGIVSDLNLPARPPTMGESEMNEVVRQLRKLVAR